MLLCLGCLGGGGTHQEVSSGGEGGPGRPREGHRAAWRHGGPSCRISPAVPVGAAGMGVWVVRRGECPRLILVPPCAPSPKMAGSIIHPSLPFALLKSQGDSAGRQRRGSPAGRGIHAVQRRRARCRAGGGGGGDGRRGARAAGSSVSCSADPGDGGLADHEGKGADLAARNGGCCGIRCKARGGASSLQAEQRCCWPV